MRFADQAIARAVRGFVAAALVTTIALLAIAPAHPFNFPPVGCGAPGAWYFNGQPESQDRHITFIQSGPTLAQLPPSCREIVNHRLRLAGITGGATVGLLAAATCITRRRRPATPVLLGQYG